jgi:hypothetical protein
VSERDTYHVWQDGELSPREQGILRAYSQVHAEEGPPDRGRHARRARRARRRARPATTRRACARALADFTAEHTRTLERRHLRLPLVYSYERSDDELEWSGPLGLVTTPPAPSARASACSTTAIAARPRPARRAATSSPSSLGHGAEEKHVSFLWHLLDYERKGERRGGHVLFIPWGDA